MILKYIMDIIILVYIPYNNTRMYTINMLMCP